MWDQWPNQLSKVPCLGDAQEVGPNLCEQIGTEFENAAGVGRLQGRIFSVPELGDPGDGVLVVGRLERAGLALRRGRQPLVGLQVSEN